MNEGGAAWSTTWATVSGSVPGRVPTSTSTTWAALTNGERLPWILDVSCNNGDFERIECFAEAWLRAGTPEQAAGAVGMYSASTTTPWVPPTVMQAEAIDLLTTGADRILGALCTHGMMEVLDTYPGDEGLQLVEQYNLFGDCSLEVRAAEPQPIAATHPSVVSDGGPGFVVEAGAGRSDRGAQPGRDPVRGRDHGSDGYDRTAAAGALSRWRSADADGHGRRPHPVFRGVADPAGRGESTCSRRPFRSAKPPRSRCSGSIP